MNPSVPTAITHFEIFGPEPQRLAEFYQRVFGWRIERMPGVDYWRIETGDGDAKPLSGGLTYRAIPGLNGVLLYVTVYSNDEAVRTVESLGGTVVRPKTAVPRAGWVTIVADPAGNIFGLWESDPKAFPMPEPD